MFSPDDFIARLAALVPRPGCNLTRYHGVFAPNSAFRRAVVPASGKHRRGQGKAASCRDDRPKPPQSGPVDDSDPPTAPLTWAQRRVTYH
ncbi:MAG: transposase [Gammaproteobacteria bacterium]|nr:transposase [Gammaproteobacteria bacterium]